MSGVLLSKDAARRVRDAVREVERSKETQASPTRGERNRVFVRLVTEVGDGEYTAEQVKRSGDEWIVFERDLFTLNEIPVFEINGVTGIDIDTVVEVFHFWDDQEVDSYWGFGATGGTSVFAVKLLGKVEAPNNPDEDRWYCEVYPDGKHGDPLPQAAPLDDTKPTVDFIFYHLTIAAGVTLPNGVIWTLATKIPDVDSLIDVPHESTPGFHYEGWIPMWFCE